MPTVARPGITGTEHRRNRPATVRRAAQHRQQPIGRRSVRSIGINPYSGRRDLNWHTTDTLTYGIGRHELRFGGEFRYNKIDEFYHSGQRGTFSFSGQQGPWGSNQTLDPYVAGLADFLAGEVSNSTIVEGNPTRNIYSNGVGFFAQDHVQLTRRLNVNFGVRYDYNQPIHNSDQNLSFFDPAVGLRVAGADAAYLYPANKKNFAPNFGFALRPSSSANTVIRGSVATAFDTVSAASFLDDSFIFNGGPYGAQYNPAGKDQVQSVSSGGYVLPTDGSNIFAKATTSSVQNLFSVSQSYKTPRLYNYSLNIQQAVGRAAVAQVGYVGSLGRHLQLLNDIDQAALGSDFALNPGDPNPTRPYYTKFPKLGVVNELNTNGNSSYNSLQASLKTSAWHGVTSQFGYTWAHTLDYGSFLALPQNSFDRHGEYGNSDFDQRHNFTAYLVYALPNYGHGPKALTNGWKLSTVFSFRSGLPFTVNNYMDISGTGEYTDRVTEIANPFAGVSHSVSTHAPVYWINVNSFSASYGQYGTLRRNQLRAAGYSDVDLTASKETAISERVHVQLRADLFNLFNRVNLASPTFTGANGVLILPGVFSQGIPLSATNGSQFGLPGIGPGEPFNAQLALKVIFLESGVKKRIPHEHNGGYNDARQHSEDGIASGAGDDVGHWRLLCGPGTGNVPGRNTCRSFNPGRGGRKRAPHALHSEHRSGSGVLLLAGWQESDRRCQARGRRQLPRLHPQHRWHQHPPHQRPRRRRLLLLLPRWKAHHLDLNARSSGAAQGKLLEPE